MKTTNKHVFLVMVRGAAGPFWVDSAWSARDAAGRRMMDLRSSFDKFGVTGTDTRTLEVPLNQDIRAAGLNPERAAIGDAIRRVRAGYEQSQEEFSRRIGVSVVSLSRYERGAAIPHAPAVLKQLLDMAMEAKMEGPMDVFRDALEQALVDGALAREMNHADVEV